MTERHAIQQIFEHFRKNPPGFERKTSDIEVTALQILKSANVTEPLLETVALQTLASAGVTSPPDTALPDWIKKRFGESILSSWRAGALKAGFRDSSPEYTAGNALDCLNRMRAWRNSNDIDMALEEAITLGALSFGFGNKMLARVNGRKASPRRYSDADIFAARQRELLQEPRPSISEANKTVGDKLRLSTRTVERACSKK